MTQAAANTINNINNGFLGEMTSAKSSDANVIEFGNVLDKETQKVSLTIGDMKENFLQNLQTNISNFQEILTDATGEATMENALDLTLCRDIDEIITQIHGFNAKIEDETESKSENEINENAIITNIGFNNILNTVIKDDNTASVEITVENTAANIETAEDTLLEDVFESKSEESGLNSLSDDMISELNIESVEQESCSSNNGYHDNGSAFEEHSVKVMLNSNPEKFEFNIQKPELANNINPKEISSEKIIEQITKQMDSMKGVQKLNIALNPESLGKVNIQLLNTKEGLAAQFTVSTNEIRDLLMKGLDGLKEALLAQGIGVNSLSVKVSEANETYSNQDWTDKEGSRGGNKENFQNKKEEKEKGLFEKTISESLEESNNT